MWYYFDNIEKSMVAELCHHKNLLLKNYIFLNQSYCKDNFAQAFFQILKLVYNCFSLACLMLKTVIWPISLLVQYWYRRSINRCTVWQYSRSRRDKCVLVRVRACVCVRVCVFLFLAFSRDFILAIFSNKSGSRDYLMKQSSATIEKKYCGHWNFNLKVWIPYFDILW